MKAHRITATIAVLAAAALACSVLARPTEPPPVVATFEPQRPDIQGNSMGAANAPVTLTQFSDYQCPFCKQFWQETESQIKAQYISTGKVRLVVRSAGNFISDNFGVGSVESQNAAMAAYCAADQGKFWEMRDALYSAQQGEESGVFLPPRLEGMARGLSLDVQGFNSCLLNNQHLADVQQDLSDAKAAGLRGVPLFVINYTAGGKTMAQIIEGAQPFSVFQQRLDAALAAAGGQ